MSEVAEDDDATIAVVFDFDDTLAPDSVTHLLTEHDIDASDFWLEDFINRVQEGYDPTIATLSLLLEKTTTDGSLMRNDLEAAGEQLSESVFEGVAGLLNDFDEIASEYAGVTVEPYIISEGLRDVIQATDIAAEFNAIYGSELATTDGEVDGIKRAISFTDKTRYLFEINKGISQTQSIQNPYEVNRGQSRSERSVPFENMIYVGDGLTDVPCFSLVQDRNGRAFGVYDETDQSPKQQALERLDVPRRVVASTNPPDYSSDSRLGSILRLTVEGLCAERTLDSLEVQSE